MTIDRSFVAVLAGASGLVGGYCLARLIASPSYQRIVVATRRDLATQVAHPTVRQAIVDFDRLDDARDTLAADHAFCALGTTLRKAGSRERFREVDFDYVLRFARITHAAGARHFTLVSSLGADPGSRAFYLRVKGELERAVQAIGFSGVTILRPSVIAGPRREFRLAERVSRWALALAPTRWRPVHADTIAAAMVNLTVTKRPGVAIVESQEIPAAART